MREKIRHQEASVSEVKKIDIVDVPLDKVCTALGYDMKNVVRVDSSRNASFIQFEESGLLKFFSFCGDTFIVDSRDQVIRRVSDVLSLKRRK